MTKLPMPVSLSDIVRSVADELREVKQDEPSEPVMSFQKCEIELAVGTVVTPGGKLKFVLFEGGVDAEYSNSQKVTLTFTALEDGTIRAIKSVL